jgi:hypothetical protein
MLVTAFPSKVFWPAMDWAVAVLAGVALVCRLAPAAATDDAQESADLPY